MNYNSMTKEELIKLLQEKENISGKYGLIWNREKEPEEIVVNCDKNIPIFEEISNKEIKQGEINNLLIKGDNFHSLSVLNYTHKEKIDIIYIDPPYNTGNKDFIYNDKIVDSEDGYKHSKWLNFMEKRLKLAQKLLKREGIIFISIDDHEQAQLKILCDTIFDNNNCLGILPTIMNLKGNQDEFGFAGTHEYTLVYAKNKSECKLGQFDINEEELEKNWQIDDIGYYKKGATLKATGTDASRTKRPYMFYPVLIKNNEINMITQEEYSKLYSKETKKFDDKYLQQIQKKYTKEKYHFLLPIQPDGSYGRWRWSYQKMLTNLNDIIINTTEYSLYKKQRPTIGELPTKKPKSLLYKAEYSSGNGTSQLQLMFGKKVFDNPKPVELIKDLIKIGSPNKDTIILDFFAGSGTTAQAVLELNQEDNGTRKFILCTNNENNIFNDVTYPRIEKVINGYKNTKNKLIQGIPSNLKCYETNFIENTNNKDQLYFDLTEKCIPLICIKEDNFIKYKITDEYQIYTNQNQTQYTCIYHSLFGEKEEEFIHELEQIKEHKSLYKFSLTDIPDLTNYNNVKNYKVEAIPYKIIELYKQLVKLTKEGN